MAEESPRSSTACCASCSASRRRTNPRASEVARRLDSIAEPQMFRRRTVWVAGALAVSVLASIAGWRALSLHAGLDKPVLLQSLPLDSEPASEMAPSFSPDGARIVYASDSASPGIHHIVTRSVAGLASGGAGSNQPLTLTSAVQDDTNPVWSPDGSRIG